MVRPGLHARLWVAVMLSVLLGAADAAQGAEPTLDRIYRTGELRVGMREDAPPFAFLGPDGRHAGFSVDMAYLLAEKLGEWAGKPIRIREVTVTPATRIPSVTSGIVDIEMGSTSMTAARELVIDFTLPFFFSETQFIVRADSGIKSLRDLNGKIVASAEGTTNLRALQEAVASGRLAPASVVTVDTHARGFLLLQQRRIDAYFTDASLLVGLRSSAQNPRDYVIVRESIHIEPYGWMVPEQDSDWRDFVNHFLLWTLETGRFYEIYDKWMGPGTSTEIPRSEAYEHYLQLVRWPGIAEVWPGRRQP